VGKRPMSYQLIQELVTGPIDIVGDIHGEIDALQALLGHLEYEAGGAHPSGRRLVFIGDLTDRGPDSPAVIEFVMDLVSRGLAQCVLGNHELNLLREARKEGNGWYFDDNHDHRKKKFEDSRALSPKERPGIRAFLLSLPIALENSDLRLVHAAWHSASIAELRSSNIAALELYELHHRRAIQLGLDTGLADRARAEEESIGDNLTNPNSVVALLPGLAAMDALHQDANPISILTSGLERVASKVFFASGKWRMVDRSRWWDAYEDPTPVIVGHYWRWPTTAARESYSRGEPDLFKGYAVNQWFGPRRNVFCVDFAVGARYKERANGHRTQFECRLAAVRWPERELVFDDGRSMDLVGSLDVME
jgi:Calcineurin-like phosphoesterase